MDTLQALSLFAATVSMGFVSGVFGLYAHTIMPGLANTDDRTFVGALQAIDRAILNPWFLVGEFVGALVFTVVAMVLHWGEDPLPLIATALVMYVVTFVVTIAVNVPLNDAMACRRPRGQKGMGPARPIGELEDVEPRIQMTDLRAGSLVISVSASSPDVVLSARSAYDRVQAALTGCGIAALVTAVTLYSEDDVRTLDDDEWRSW